MTSLPTQRVAADRAIPIRHRDDRIVAVSKPSGLVVHHGWEREGRPLLQRVRDQIGRYVYPVHRLDRGASGLVVFALDRDAARELCSAFADGRAEKTYQAITRGHPPREVRVDHPVPKTPRGDRVHAVTDFTQLETFGRYAWVEARPRTGRLHQIRRHAKHLSCPLIGDVNYGKGEHNRIFREQHSLTRLALHATELRVPHPDTGEILCLSDPLAEDITRAIESCRRAYADGSERDGSPAT